MTNKARWILGVGAVLCGAVIATGVFAQGGGRKQTQAQGQKAPEIEPRAQEVLRGMSDYLVSLPGFSVKTETVDEIVLKSGQKLQFPATSKVYVKRPDRLRSDRVGDPMDASLFYDGSKMTLFGRKSNLYASAPAPKTIDEAIDFARKDLQMDAPAADLFYSQPYEVLTEDVINGRYLGTMQVDGVSTHHLAFQGNETDWEIWIDDTAQPLPRRFVITSKKVASWPQFTVAMKDWDVSPLLTAEMFTFEPPQNAEQIEFKEVWERVAAKKAALNQPRGQTR